MKKNKMFRLSSVFIVSLFNLSSFALQNNPQISLPHPNDLLQKRPSNFQTNVSPKKIPTKKKLERKINFIAEINPLLLVNQGIGLNTELLVAEHVSIGSNFEGYVQTPYSLNGVNAERYMWNISPFVRFYPLSNLQRGFFAGMKLNFFHSEAKISDNSAWATQTNFFLAPSVHAGYRFVNKQGFTVSGFAGVGWKLGTDNRFPDDAIPEQKKNNQSWLDAQKLLNRRTNSALYDFGLTIGYLF